jgi:hypothetical protein
MITAISLSTCQRFERTRNRARGKETASARAGKLRPFHKVPRERDIDTILMWVIEPSIPLKCVLEERLGLSSCATAPESPHRPAGRQKYGPSSGEAEAEV